MKYNMTVRMEWKCCPKTCHLMSRKEPHFLSSPPGSGRINPSHISQRDCVSNFLTSRNCTLESPYSVLQRWLLAGARKYWYAQLKMNTNNRRQHQISPPVLRTPPRS